MSDICFVFASAAEKNADKIVGKYLKDIDYDIQFLSSGSKDKILKKDIDLEMSVLDDYKLVCPIGADALKYVTGITGITKYNGVHLEKKIYAYRPPKYGNSKTTTADPTPGSTADKTTAKYYSCWTAA